MNKHKLVPAGPTDDELIAWAGEEQFFLFCDRDEFLQIARAVMQRYAAPQPAEQQPDVTLLLSLLSHARCNTCDGSGGLYDNHGQPHQCQWCHERSEALSAYREGGDV